MGSTTRPLRRLLAGLAAASVMLLSLLAPTSPAQAQGTEAVVGTADFRNPPVLTPGSSTDTIVTGETVWYGVIYSNDAPYRFDVDVPGVAVGADPDLTLTTTFLDPALQVADRGADALEGKATYDNGRTNLWYLTVSLTTTGTPGVSYPLLITIDGVESTGLADCTADPDCTFDEELATIRDATETAKANLASIADQESEASVKLEIESLNGFKSSAETLLPQSEARLANAEAVLAQVCAPAATCDSYPVKSSTPLIGWVFGLGVFAFGARRAYTKLRTPADSDEAK